MHRMTSTSLEVKVGSARGAAHHRSGGTPHRSVGVRTCATTSDEGLVHAERTPGGQGAPTDATYSPHLVHPDRPDGRPEPRRDQAGAWHRCPRAARPRRPTGRACRHRGGPGSTTGSRHWCASGTTSTPASGAAVSHCAPVGSHNPDDAASSLEQGRATSLSDDRPGANRANQTRRGPAEGHTRHLSAKTRICPV